MEPWGKLTSSHQKQTLSSIKTQEGPWGGSVVEIKLRKFDKEDRLHYGVAYSCQSRKTEYIFANNNYKKYFRFWPI